MLKVTSEESKLVVTLVQILLVGRCAWLGGRMGANSNQWLSEGFPATIASSTTGPRAMMDFAGQVQCSRAAMALDHKTGRRNFFLVPVYRYPYRYSTGARVPVL